MNNINIQPLLKEQENLEDYDYETHDSGGINSGHGSSQNVEQIREILFGNQMRLLEKRIDSIGQMARQSSTKTRNELINIVNVAKDKIAADITSIKNDLLNESNNFKADMENSNASWQGRISSVEEQMHEISRKVSQVEENFNSQLLEQSKFVYSEIQDQLSQMKSHLDSKISALEQDKISYQKLSKVMLAISDMVLQDDKTNANEKSPANAIKPNASSSPQADKQLPQKNINYNYYSQPRSEAKPLENKKIISEHVVPNYNNYEQEMAKNHVPNFQDSNTEEEAVISAEDAELNAIRGKTAPIKVTETIEMNEQTTAKPNINKQGEMQQPRYGDSNLANQKPQFATSTNEAEPNLDLS